MRSKLLTIWRLSNGSRATLLLAAALLLMIGASARAQGTCTVNINAATDLGPYIRASSRINISYIPTSSLATLERDNDNWIAKGMGANCVRLFINPVSFKSNNAYYDHYVTDASRVGSTVMLAFNSPPTNGSLPVAAYRAELREILNRYKTPLSKVVYIEAMNEYELSGISDSTYYNTWYKMFYEELNLKNSTLGEGVTPLQLGGPVLSKWQPAKMQAFINHYAADTNPAKKLDFLVYHEYFNDSGTVDPDLIADLQNRRSTIVGYLSAAGLSTNIPIHITEGGTFPGATFTPNGYTMPHGLLQQAASFATMNYYAIVHGQAKVYPHMWSTRLKDSAGAYMPYKSLLTPDYSKAELTPFGNTMYLLSQLPNIRISATSNGINPSSGKGVYALAAKSSNRVGILIWNWQHRGTLSYTTTVKTISLPSAFAGKPVKMSRYLIDATHSNYYTHPAGSGALSVVDTSNNFNPASYVITVAPNTVTYIRLDPGS